MKSKAFNLKVYIETTKMQLMNKHYRGGEYTQPSNRARSKLSLAEIRDTSRRLRCRLAPGAR